MSKTFILIFTATSLEYSLVKKNIHNKRQTKYLNYLYCFGEINHFDVMLVKSGMGLLNTRKAFEAIINHGYNIIQVINIGIAGALNPSYSIGSVSLVNKVIDENDKRNYLLQPPILKEFSIKNVKKQKLDISKIALQKNTVLVSVKNPVGSLSGNHFIGKHLMQI